MKAVLFTRDGFRRDIEVAESSRLIRTFKMGGARPIKDEDIPTELNILSFLYILEWEFINEYNENILIYREAL